MAYRLPWTDFDTCTLAELPTPIPVFGSGGLGLSSGSQPNIPERQASPTNSAVFYVTDLVPELCRPRISHCQHNSCGVAGPPAGGDPARPLVVGDNCRCAARRRYSMARNSCPCDWTLCSTEQSVSEAELSLDRPLSKPAGTVTARQNNGSSSAPCRWIAHFALRSSRPDRARTAVGLVELTLTGR